MSFFLIQIWDMNNNLEKIMKTYSLLLEILTSKKHGCMKTPSTEGLLARPLKCFSSSNQCVQYISTEVSLSTLEQSSCTFRSNFLS